MAHLELLTRAWDLLRSAQSLVRDGNVTGSAGLAYQAFDLAAKALTQASNGNDAGGHHRRMRRAQRLLTTHADRLDFLWELRQRDFYGDVRPGAGQELPKPEEVEEAVTIVEAILTEIDQALHP